MIVAEQPILFTPDTTHSFKVTYEPMSTRFANWELTRMDGRTVVETDDNVYNVDGVAVVIPDIIYAAAFLRVKDKLLNKDYYFCMESDDQDLLAFDNSGVMAKLREFCTDDTERIFYVSNSYYVFTQPPEKKQDAVCSTGYFVGIPKEYLQIDLVDALTGTVVKAIYGSSTTTTLEASI